MSSKLLGNGAGIILDSYLVRLKTTLADIPSLSLENIATELFAVKRHQGVIYVCGNGGSHANASHFVLHLLENGFHAIDLMAETPSLSALSNDRSYAKAGFQRLRWAASAKDALVVFSGSGDSENVLLALTEAKRLQMATIGILGFGGGAALYLCTVALVVGSKDYGPVEDSHSVVLHVLTELLCQPS